jgi:hypothetical protein
MSRGIDTMNRLLLLLFLALTALASLVLSPGATAAERPNVILIMADDME